MKRSSFCKNRSRLDPFYSGQYILLGKSYLKKRELRRAPKACFKRAIQFDPNNKSAHYLLGQVYQQSGRAGRREARVCDRRKITGRRRLAAEK